VRAVLEQCPRIQLEIDISIDGFSETHDRIRAVPGNFNKALLTMKELETLRKAWPNLTLYVNSVTTSENRTEIVPLGRYFSETHDLDGHYFQIIRGDPKDQSLQAVKRDELKETYREVLPLNFRYISAQLRNYANGAKWKMPCTAGQTSVVIDYNADVRVCEKNQLAI
jgi:MoaA/NifB/PqqE/SkfB family radical SAM enzyme